MSFPSTSRGREIDAPLQEADAYASITNRADVLHRAAELHGKVWAQEVSPDSLSAHDQDHCETKTDAIDAAQRVVVVANLLSLVASDLAAAASVVMRSGISVFGLFPLARAIVENSGAAAWVLSPSVDPEIRWGRAALIEFDTATRNNENVLQFKGKDSDLYRQARSQRRALKKELEAQLGKFGDLKLDAPPFMLCGETLPSAESLALDALAELHGQPDTWSGYYSLMCRLGTHPSLAAPVEGGVVKVQDDLLDHVTACAMVAYHAALSCIVTWCGWSHELLIGFAGDINEMLPGTFGGRRT